ncbi:uncharacterized protein LOC107807223 isoform X1 [Nicotiana tabacum]|uniref:Uncharacterized protein LOC107807223 isoform X1 n=3 Tax=Nicotiana tabacum TaxID=4097 RepID=A0A1S4BDW7_TOBAC|nr:PREDICTED: uncharacterized protein LOC107807223 [Nicotiana tabacum]
MWTYTKTKYDIHDDGKEWVFQSIQNAWRRYKCWLKKNYYEAYANDELRMEKKPSYVSESEFKYLLEYRKSNKVQAEMEKIQTQKSEDDNQSVDAFATVMGSKHPGRVRLYGRGVTKIIFKQKSRKSGPSSNTTYEMMGKNGRNERDNATKDAEKVRATTENLAATNYI